jgi:hypothetical protein
MAVWWSLLVDPSSPRTRSCRASRTSLRSPDVNMPRDLDAPFALPIVEVAAAGRRQIRSAGTVVVRRNRWTVHVRALRQTFHMLQVKLKPFVPFGIARQQSVEAG